VLKPFKISLFIAVLPLFSALSEGRAEPRARCAPLKPSAHFVAHGELNTLERPPTPDIPSAPIAIALHGLGHHKEGFSSIAARLPASWRVVSADAPLRYGRGYAWYRFRCPEAEADLKRSTQVVITLAKRLKERYPSAPRPVLFGFSQGGVMSLNALKQAPLIWSAVASLSGYWLPQASPHSAPKNAPPLLITHGAQDKVVPLERGERAAALFSEAGYSVAWQGFEGGHNISREAMRALRSLFEITKPKSASVR
jgi:phospholipase/carboxylesterase